MNRISWDLVRLMRHMAAHTFIAVIMVGGLDLFYELGPRRILFMATQAKRIRQVGKFDVRIIHMRLGHTMAGFAGDGLVLFHRQFVDDVIMTFHTGFFPGKERLAGSDLFNSGPAEETILMERL